jgi:hypothetical protein
MVGESPGLVADGVDSTDAKLYEQAQVLDLAIAQWVRNPKPWDRVEMVETEISKKLAPGLEVFGRPDAVVMWKGAWWHVQHKTVAAGVPVGVFAAGVRVSLHESIYAGLLRTKYPQVRGTMLNVVRKISRKRVVEDPNSALHIEFISIPERMTEMAERDLLSVVARMDSGNPPTRADRKRCVGVYGNSLCEAYGVCWGGEGIESLPQINPLEGYAAAVGAGDGEVGGGS